jgi:hypothetical protein
MLRPFSRRRFFVGALAAAPLAKSLPAFDTVPAGDSRSQTALELRKRTAASQSKRAVSAMATNGDEALYANRVACFSKGLPHDASGEVQPLAYDALLKAIKSGAHADFERIPRGGGRKLNNPQSAFAYHLEGGDPHTFEISPPPSFTTVANAAECSELYWQALCRDIPFQSFSKSSLVQQAAKHLQVAPSKLFRGTTKGDLAGPYISQFLLKPIPFGSGKIEQRYRVPAAGSDFLTMSSEWSQIQSGIPPWRAATYEEAPRYIRNGRDLAEFVHYDFPYQASLGTALILLNSGPNSVLNCNQFRSAANPYRYSTVQEGFVTFGQAEVTDWLGRVTTAALKAAYCQKWMVHRRLRPEALGGLIQQTRTGARDYPLPLALTNSAAVESVFARTGSYLLPQAYPEGSPLHPSYPAGHAAVAGACSVVLKTCFDSSMLLPACVEPAADGLSLEECRDYSPTVGEEVNKLAFNVSMGRNWAGIHYRSDCVAGLKLGEDVAISILQDLAHTYTEDFKGFTFQRLSGVEVHITPQGEVVEG